MHAKMQNVTKKNSLDYITFIKTIDAAAGLDCLWHANKVTHDAVKIEHKDITKVLAETDVSRQILQKLKEGVVAGKNTSLRRLEQIEEANAIHVTQVKQQQDLKNPNVQSQLEPHKGTDAYSKVIQGKLKVARSRYESLANYFLEQIKDLEEDTDFIVPEMQTKDHIEVRSTQCQDKIFHFNTFRLRFCSEKDLKALATVDDQINAKHQRKNEMKRWRTNTVLDADRTYEVKGAYPPYDHQWTMYKIHMSEDASADLSDMGTGKTYSVLMTIDTRIQRGEIERGRIIIICPTTVIPNWERQIKLHTPHLTSAIIKGRYLERIQRMMKPDADILLVNYESFSMMLKLDKNTAKEVEIPFHDLASTVDWDMVVLDECHKIKNIDAKRTAGVIKAFEKTKYKIIMSGTVNANTIADIYVPFYFLNQGRQFSCALEKPNTPGRYAMSTLYEYFRRNYLADGATKETMSLLTAAMEEISVRFKKHECLDLPAKVYETIPIEMERKQRELYQALENQIVTELKNYMDSGGVVSAIGAFGKLAKLSEAANGWLYDRDGKAVEFPWNPKLKALLELLEGINLNNGSKVVVWVRFNNDAHLLTKELRKVYGKASIACMHGGSFCHVCESDTATRFDTVTDFNRPESAIKVAVVNSAVGSHGIDLVGANYEVFYSNSYIKTDRIQAEDRCHRPGMRDSLTIIDLVMNRSIDGDVLEVLKTHKSVSKVLLDRLGLDSGSIS